MGFTIRRAEMPLPDDIQHINASLEKVGTNLKAYKESTEERLNAFQADMQALQQTVAAGAHNLGPQFSTGPSVGTRAAEAISTDPSFAAARDQAERNMKVSQFAARANIDASIKA
ncbi:hypothetical protein, partial [Nonomuraea sp. NPDC003804]|uniref:hypothetical protein n=1 Tax=Nonomuraea sp. NPDC003804 TaxID=3154547 RepID=UPI0033A5F3B6